MIKLIQGDCLDYMKTLEDNSIDVVVTDPPYGIGEAAGKNKSRGTKLFPSKDFGSNDWDNQRPSIEIFNEILRVSKNQVIFGGNYFADLLLPSSCWLVWDKNNGSTDFADCELAWTSFKTAVRYFKYTWNGFMQGNISNKKNNEKRVHPTQKPLPLMEWVIKNYTKESDTILDPFMGSGTTGVACMNFNRKFIGIEKEEQFFQVATDRIEAAAAQTSF